MDIKYKRKPDSSHMIISCPVTADSYKEKMVLNNKIDCLLDFSKSEMGNEYEYWYNISDKKSVKGFFIQENICSQSIIECLYAINDSLKCIRKYLLNSSDIVFSEDTIFLGFDGYKWKSYFAYLPKHDFDFKKGILNLVEFLIENVNHEDEKSTKICYELYEKVVSEDVTIQALIDLVQKNEAEFADAEMPIDQNDIDYIKRIEDCQLSDEELFVLDEKKQKRHRFRFPWKKKNNKDKKAIELEEVCFEPGFFMSEIEDSATTVLSADDSPIYRSLVYEGGGKKESIHIDKTPFRIGSKTGMNDAVINEGVISRAHAEIIIEEDRYYIKDLESKNGTFVNGIMLAFNKRLELTKGDRVSFANIGYRFE